MSFKINRAISNSNHMFGKAIWGKLPESILENYENFQKSRGSFIPKIARIKHAGTGQSHQNKCLLTGDNYKSASGQLQNNSVNGVIMITINRVTRRFIM